MNLQRFPRYPLTFGPTPIQHLKRLSEHLGGKVEIYAKRDDCNIDLIVTGEIPAGSRVLYAHLGGAPALNGYSFLFRNG